MVIKKGYMPEFSIESAQRIGGKVQKLTSSYGVRDCALIKALAFYSSLSRLRAKMDVFPCPAWHFLSAQKPVSPLRVAKNFGPSAKTPYIPYFRSV
jgi:hypothetical protein